MMQNSGIMNDSKDVNLHDDDYSLLRERVCSFVSRHPEGVNMNDLETEFNESRFRLGYILSRLLSESRITRTYNRLYPVSKD